MRYVLDTTAFSSAMRREQELLDLLKSHLPQDIVTVPPVIAEIHFGIEMLDHLSRKYSLLKRELDLMLSIVETLPWTPEASFRFGTIKSELEKKGTLIDDFDIAIGAIAMAHECCVITANIEHFRRIGDLTSIFWN